MVEKRASLAQRLLLWSGYGAFFFACFVLFAYWTFPYDRVRDVLIERAQASAPGSTVAIEDVSPHWLTGLTLSAVRVETAPGAKDEPPTVLAFDELTVSVAPFALAMGDTGVNFSAALGEGELSGSYRAQTEGDRRVEAELDAVDLGALGLGSYLKVPMKGLATGDIDVTLAKDPAATEGAIEIVVEGFAVGDGKSKVALPGGWGGVTVPEMDLGTLSMSIAIKEAVATVENFESKGGGVSMSGSGSVRLTEPLSRSRADLTIGIKVDEAFQKREPKIQTVLGLPQVKSATGDDGMIRFGLTGTLSALRAAPGAGTRSGKRGLGRAARNKDTDE